MPMQNTVNMSWCNRVIHSFLVCLGNLADFDNLTPFCTFFKRFKNSFFLSYAQIASISAVMVADDPFKTFFAIFIYKT